MNEWQLIETAPKDGTRFHARGRVRLRVRQMPGSILPGSRMATTTRVSWWGKTSHVPLYGWCHGRVEDVDLWSPTHWRPIVLTLRVDQPERRSQIKLNPEARKSALAG